MQPQSFRFTVTFARKNVPMMITAHHVQNVNSMTSTGNKVFRLQITSQGPMANNITTMAMARVTFKMLSNIINLLDFL